MFRRTPPQSPGRGEEENPYLLSFADIMAGLLGLFILALISVMVLLAITMPERTGAPVVLLEWAEIASSLAPMISLPSISTLLLSHTAMPSELVRNTRQPRTVTSWPSA